MGSHDDIVAASACFLSLSLFITKTVSHSQELPPLRKEELTPVDVMAKILDFAKCHRFARESLMNNFVNLNVIDRMSLSFSIQPEKAIHEEYVRLCNNNITREDYPFYWHYR